MSTPKKGTVELLAVAFVLMFIPVVLAAVVFSQDSGQSSKDTQDQGDGAISTAASPELVSLDVSGETESGTVSVSSSPEGEIVTVESSTPEVQIAAEPDIEPKEPPDLMAELHIMRMVFDNNYRGPFTSLEYPSRVLTDWAEWEDAYFNREYYRAVLEEIVARDWSVGPWWWQAEVQVHCLSELDRGGPIIFTVDYPWVDFRGDLNYEVTKPETGTYVRIVDSGQYHPPRHGYLVATIIMLVVTATVVALIALASFLVWKLANAIVDFITGWIAPMGASRLWVRRFVICLLAAIACVVVTVVWAIL